MLYCVIICHNRIRQYDYWKISLSEQTNDSTSWKIVKEANDKAITSEEALRCFLQYVKYMKWNNVNITATKFYRDFKIAMLRYHPECRETTNIPVQDSRKRIRGYHGCYVVLPKKL